MKFSFMYGLSLVNLLFIGGCGKDSTAPSSTTTTSTSAALSSLPAAVGPVTAASSSPRAQARNEFFQEQILPRLATGGLKLSAAGSTTSFSSGHSTAMCETVNITKSVLREVAQPDKILCYIEGMAASSIIPSNIADGSYHYIKLVNLSDSGSDSNSTPYIKMRITLSGSTLTDFKMFSCFSGTTTAPTQSEYVSVTNTNSSATILSKYTGVSGSATYGSTTTASGTINSAGNWIGSKTINASNYYTDTSSSFNMGLTLTQDSSTITISGTKNGSFSYNNTSQSFSNALYTVAQIINASALNTFAIGDGSSKYSITFTSGNMSYVSGTMLQSWNGDTLASLSSAASGDFYTTVNSGTLPTIPSSVSAVTFSGDQSWDCSLPSGASWVNADFNSGDGTITTRMASCNTTFDPGSDWVNCSSTYN